MVHHHEWQVAAHQGGQSGVVGDITDGHETVDGRVRQHRGAGIVGLEPGQQGEAHAGVVPHRRHAGDEHQDRRVREQVRQRLVVDQADQAGAPPPEPAGHGVGPRVAQLLGRRHDSQHSATPLAHRHPASVPGAGSVGRQPRLRPELPLGLARERVLP